MACAQASDPFLHISLCIVAYIYMWPNVSFEMRENVEYVWPGSWTVDPTERPDGKVELITATCTGT